MFPVFANNATALRGGGARYRYLFLDQTLHANSDLQGLAMKSEQLWSKCRHHIGFPKRVKLVIQLLMELKALSMHIFTFFFNMVVSLSRL